MPPAPAKPQASAQRKATPRDHPAPELHPARRKAAERQPLRTVPTIEETLKAETTQNNTAPPPPNRPSSTREAENPQRGRPPQDGSPRPTTADSIATLNVT